MLPLFILVLGGESFDVFIGEWTWGGIEFWEKYGRIIEMPPFN